MADTVWMRGEGGSIIKMRLPFPDAIAARVASGQIVRVNEDGSPWIEPEASKREERRDDNRKDTKADKAGGVERPAQSAPKPEWVAYAESCGMSPSQATSMTRAELVEEFSA